MKRIYSLALLALLTGCNSTPKETYLGLEVIQMPFTINNDQTLYLPVTDAGTVPATQNGYAMTYAGFNITPSKSVENQAEMTWGFAFKSTKSGEIESIKIEELPSTAPKQTLIELSNPKIKDGYWKFNFEPIIANKENTPWVYKDKASIFVFRITIIEKSGIETILTQPTWFSKPLLTNFIKQIELIENG